MFQGLNRMKAASQISEATAPEGRRIRLNLLIVEYLQLAADKTARSVCQPLHPCSSAPSAAAWPPPATSPFVNLLIALRKRYSPQAAGQGQSRRLN